MPDMVDPAELMATATVATTLAIAFGLANLGQALPAWLLLVAGAVESQPGVKSGTETTCALCANTFFAMLQWIPWSAWKDRDRLREYRTGDVYKPVW